MAAFASGMIWQRHVDLQIELISTNTVRRSVRDIFINQVLATDMKKHFDIVSRFQVS